MKAVAGLDVLDIRLARAFILYLLAGSVTSLKVRTFYQNQWIDWSECLQSIRLAHQGPVVQN